MVERKELKRRIEPVDLTACILRCRALAIKSSPEAYIFFHRDSSSSWERMATLVETHHALKESAIV